MRAILMSIRPEWCEKIFNGEKTIEVRKTAPKLETPFTVYVYQTKIKFKVKNWQERYIRCLTQTGAYLPLHTPTRRAT